MVDMTSDFTRKLVDVAMGRHPADLVIRNGRWVSVQSGEIIPNIDIAICDDRIAYVGEDASHTIGEFTQLIDAHDHFLVPGLIDAHMHVESGMLTVSEFVRAVVPHGTTAMIIDPHEIANVFGLRGVRLMVDEASLQPIHVWVQVPSCVPSAPGLETPGAAIGPQEVAEALKWPGIIGLGEVMNFPGVYQNDEKIHSEMAETHLAGKVIGGHYASPDLGNPFHGYVAGGPEDDHEGTTKEDAIARVRQGMKAMLRLGSGWLDVAEGVRALTELKLDPHRFILCTDDSHSETLVCEGHVDRAVREAVANGVVPITAIQMATINAAEHFGLSREIGMIAPRRYADILIVENLGKFKAQTVIARGKVVADNYQFLASTPTFQYPEWAINSVLLKREIIPSDFDLISSVPGKVHANVIGILENQAPTRHMQFLMPVEDGKVKIDIQRDVVKIAVIERHHGTGRVTTGLVHGFGFNRPCGIASTVAHDSHHLLVIGTDEADMAAAANYLAKIGGGQAVVSEGKVIGQVALPIAGLMSNHPAEDVANQAETVLDGFRSCGCKLNNPNMQLSLLALPVIPELRISDLGLVDVTKFQMIPVLEKV